jgi:hypothetical protein
MTTTNNIAASSYSISISEDGIWAGKGTYTGGGNIKGCAAMLPEEVYTAIEDTLREIPQGGEIKYGGKVYSWVLVSNGDEAKEGCASLFGLGFLTWFINFAYIMGTRAVSGEGKVISLVYIIHIIIIVSIFLLWAPRLGYHFKRLNKKPLDRSTWGYLKKYIRVVVMILYVLITLFQVLGDIAGIGRNWH